jgi:D-glycero-D-manno-heptose 1,7-bisphosphate phosphatase
LPVLLSLRVKDIVSMESRCKVATRPPIVFVDRDGTLIEDRGYIAKVEQVAVLPQALAAIRRLNEMQIPVVLVTNQSGIGRGLISELEYRALHRHLECRLRAEGAFLSGHAYCPDPPTIVGRRKPSSAMFLEAANMLGIDATGAAFIGDQLRDVVPAPLFQGTAWLVGTGKMLPSKIPDWVQTVPSILDAVTEITMSGKR